MRLIDADALLKDVRKNSESYFAEDFAHEWVDKQPTIDAEPVKHGRWIPSKDGHGCECSECGTAYRWSEIDTMRYCKICGARMDDTPTEIVDTSIKNTNRPTDEVEE